MNRLADALNAVEAMEAAESAGAVAVEAAEASEAVRPLQAVAPGCYSRLLSELEAFHLHPYDVMAGAVMEDAEVDITLRFGSELAHEERRRFRGDALERIDDEVIAFFRMVGEKCSKALVADYYRMMKP